MVTSLAAPHSGPVQSKSPLTSIKALELFGVAFVSYGWETQTRRISAAAEQMLAPKQDRSAVLTQIDIAVGVAERTGAPRASSEHVVFVRRIPIPNFGHVRIYVSGRPFVEPRAVVILEEAQHHIPQSEWDSLTSREREVASLVSDGLSTKQIAVQLGVSVHTARHHTERVFAKLGVGSRVSLVRMLVHGSPR